MRSTYLALTLVLAGGAAIACADEGRAMPRCQADQRLGLVAQSVPDAAYLPCIAELPTGWRAGDLEISDAGTTFRLTSDRASQPVVVAFADECDPGAAVPIPARAEGVRSSQLLTSIDPSYRGTIFELFPGGCITYDFAFERGPHIGLMDELTRTIGLYPRRQLAQELRAELGIDLDP